MLPRWVTELARGRVVIVAVVLAAAYFLLVTNFTPYRTLQRANQNEKLLEERWGYDAAQVRWQLANFGDDWRRSYRNFQIVDYLNALFIPLALLLVLTWIGTRVLPQRSPLLLLAWLPPLALAVADVVENTLLISFTVTYPQISSVLAGIASAATWLKLASVSAGLILMLLGMAVLVGKKLFKKTA